LRRLFPDPIIVVEVLSKSTESYDRGDKFYKYRQIKSLQEYILIDQAKPQIEIYKRQKELWQITRVSGSPESIILTSIGVEIKLEDVYQDVEFLEEG
jgi:Uma2 family endonuclease